jgi:protease-4
VGLVDSLGGLDEAVAAAAARSDLADYEIRRIGTPLSPEQLILEQIGKELGTGAVPGLSALRVFAEQLSQPLRVVDSLRDPQHLYVRCLECAGGL